MNGSDTNEPLDLAQLERDVRRMRAEAVAQMAFSLRGWFAARRAARHQTRLSGKARAA